MRPAASRRSRPASAAPRPEPAADSFPADGLWWLLMLGLVLASPLLLLGAARPDDYRR